ncbi:MAG TPA: hypothetical protein VK158_04685 [Acidobacteriota bacterium]|nr:hypothetical protein [Acidobacteriota bacterium]
MNTKPLLAASLVILIILLVTGCVDQSKKNVTQDPQELCATNGGEWKNINVYTPTEQFACVYTYDDANKECTDASQCKSNYCKASSQSNPTSGTCYPYSVNTDDCQYPMINGALGMALCK